MRRPSAPHATAGRSEYACILHLEALLRLTPGQRTGSEEEGPVAVHPGTAGTEMNAWATAERQMEDGATLQEVICWQRYAFALQSCLS